MVFITGNFFFKEKPLIITGGVEKGFPAKLCLPDSLYTIQKRRSELRAYSSMHKEKEMGNCTWLGDWIPLSTGDIKGQR